MMKLIRKKLLRQNDGLETVEFVAVFIVFMILTLGIVQIFVFFANSVAVNIALVDASQRASAQGGLTPAIANRFYDSVPQNICKPVGGVCTNITLTPKVFDSNMNPTGASTCASSIAGSECTHFGDMIQLSVRYTQDWIIDFNCLAGAGGSTGGGSCSDSPGHLTFNQKLLVGSQSLIGLNK